MPRRASLLPGDVAELLDRLCVQLGFCLPADAYERLQSDPPEDADSFTQAVFQEEGLSPDMADRHLYRSVRATVATAFERAGSGNSRF